MKKISVYEMANGELIKGKAEAEKRAKELEFEAAVSTFADKHGCYTDGKETLYRNIMDNVKELKEILSILD